MRLVQQLLAERGVDFPALVVQWRADGRGWPEISGLLHDEHAIELSRWTLARWFPDEPTAVAS